MVAGRVDAEVQLVLMRFLSALASAALSLLWMGSLRIHTRSKGKTAESLSLRRYQESPRSQGCLEVKHSSLLTMPKAQ